MERKKKKRNVGEEVDIATHQFRKAIDEWDRDSTEMTSEKIFSGDINDFGKAIRSLGYKISGGPTLGYAIRENDVIIAFAYPLKDTYGDPTGKSKRCSRKLIGI